MVSRHGRKSVKTEDLKLQCEWGDCREVFTDLSDFYSHLDSHYVSNYNFDTFTNDMASACKWNECPFMTNCNADLLRHLYFHGYHTKVKWWGLLCHQKEGLGECRALHNRNIIPELPDGFRCEWTDCLMVFDIPDQFYMHVYNHALFADEETFQDGRSGFACHWEGCSYTYETRQPNKLATSRFKLREHLRTHTKERCYACPWCGNLYVNKTKFTDHLSRQVNIESHCFQCTHCSRTFATERLLKDHMRHHVNHYKCPKCAMTCPNPSALKHHMRYKHSDERPYACQYCPYRSKAAYDLQVHLTFHQSDLSYRCHVEGCDYAVRSLQNLRYHFRTKHMVGNGKCYACHLCAKRYAVGFQLTHHLRTAHSFQWPPGHSRFKYKECEDGLLRLQTFRFESVELTEELMVYDQTTTGNEPETQNNKNQSVKGKANVARRKQPSKPSLQPTNRITTRSAATFLQKLQKKDKPKSQPRKIKKLVRKRICQTENESIPSCSTSSQDSHCPDSNVLQQGIACSQQGLQLDSFNQRDGSGGPGISGDFPSNSTPLKENGSPPLKVQRVSQKPLSPIHNKIPDDEQDTPPSDDNNKPHKMTVSNVAQTSVLPQDEEAYDLHDNLAMVDGIVASDDKGESVSVDIDGERYYLVQGKSKDDPKAITYCLVNAKKYDEDSTTNDTAI